MMNVLITGAGNGLGYELTKLYADKGYRVFALTRTIHPRLQAVAEEYPENVLAIQCDVGSTESVKNAMKLVAEQTEDIEVIYNNAGIHRFEDWVPLFVADLDFCKEMYDINAIGPLRIVKEALPLLKEGSVIVNISSGGGSIGGMTGTTNYAYCMSKAAMNMGGRIMDNWLSGWGIRTLMIHPGRMRSGMRGPHSNIAPLETAEALVKMIENVDSIPKENMFMDYLGNPMEW